MNNDLLLREEVFQIIGAAMEVSKIMCCGLSEKPFENALVVEFELRKIAYRQQERFPVIYKKVKVGEYIPDLIAFDSVVVDTKVINGIGNLEIAQMINYLKITGLQVGVILNFKHPKLEWQRVVHTERF